MRQGYEDWEAGRDLPVSWQNTLNAGVRELQSNRSSGASELARRALQILADCAKHWPEESAAQLASDLSHYATTLASTRPSMTPLQTLLARWQAQWVALSETDAETARSRAIAIAQDLERESRQAVERVAWAASQRIGGNCTILTHSFSSTVVATFAHLRDRHVRAIVSEARPLCEGYTLARQLAVGGIPVSLITDAQLGLFVEQADLVLVGADTVLADGAVVNKAGTYLLALAAHTQQKPVYVAYESFKYRPAELGAVELEEMAPIELGVPSDVPVEVRNIYFDITPPQWVTGWIDEHGYRPYQEWDGT